MVHNGVSCSYAQFARLIEACRQYLGQQHLLAGSVAVIDVQSLADGWILGLALRSLGLTTFAVRGAADIDKLNADSISCVVTAVAENRPAPLRPPAAPAWRLIRVPSEQSEIEAAKNAELRVIKRVPLRIVFIDRLPRNDMGKIERLVLKRHVVLASAGKQVRNSAKRKHKPEKGHA
jgi:hypothetical protein